MASSRRALRLSLLRWFLRTAAATNSLLHPIGPLTPVTPCAGTQTQLHDVKRDWVLDHVSGSKVHASNMPADGDADREAEAMMPDMARCSRSIAGRGARLNLRDSQRNLDCLRLLPILSSMVLIHVEVVRPMRVQDRQGVREVYRVMRGMRRRRCGHPRTKLLETRSCHKHRRVLLASPLVHGSACLRK